MSTLTVASSQWSSRPGDERYGSLADLHAATSAYRAQAREARNVPYSSLRVQAEGDDVLLMGKANVPSKLTNWAFGQLSARVGAPAGFLRDLPATLASQVLNNRLAERGAGAGECSLLLHSNGGYKVRALTGPDYSRIWDADVTARLLRLVEERPEWQPAPAAFDGSRGLYASDHDVFAFMVDNDRRIFEKAPGGGLGRGFFASNSETGAASFKVVTFLFEYVCGNHRVWGASGVQELRVRHVGAADDRAFAGLQAELTRYADSSAADDEAKVESAMRYSLGSDKDAVLDRVFGLRIPELSRKLLSEAYDRAELHSDWYGSPRTAWGFAGGLTELSRDMVHADKRVAVDRAAGRVMAVAF